MTGFVDFHTHSHLSDGYHTPEQLIEKAIQTGIRVLAITDHNTPIPNLSLLQAKYREIRLIPGCEISCIWRTSNFEKELHVVALGCDFNHPKIISLLKQNNLFDRAIYINRILTRLQDCNIYLGTYEQLKSRYPATHHLGRKHIAAEMVRLGYVNTIDEAFDLYIGAFGQKRAYVKNKANYVSLEDAVEAICASGGIAILAHLFYYQLSEEQNISLLKHFKHLVGNKGGLEVLYSAYSDLQRRTLQKLADEFQLLPSAGSDYHGTESETLSHHFPYEIYEAIEALI